MPFSYTVFFLPFVVAVPVDESDTIRASLRETLMQSRISPKRLNGD
jgi:hypothetical protein